MTSIAKIRQVSLGFVGCFLFLAGCGDAGVDEKPQEVFEPITYEPNVEQDHIKDGVFTSEPYDTDIEE